MANPKETKHAAFLRLMQNRLGRTLDMIRLVRQLSSTNYENTAEEAREVIVHLDEAIRGIAEVFGVPYSTRIGHAKSNTVGGARPIVGPSLHKRTILDEVEIVRTLEHLRNGDYDKVDSTLRSALNSQAT